MIRLMTILVLVCMTFGAAWAAEKPTADETNKVIDYYYHGQGKGAVLMDYYICGKIGLEDGADKNECLERANPAQIQLDQELYLWMSFLVPADDAADIIVAYSRKARVRRTSSIKLTGATRFRTWKRIPAGKAGQWSISIMQELDDRDLELGSLQYTVSKPTP